MWEVTESSRHSHGHLCCPLTLPWGDPFETTQIAGARHLPTGLQKVPLVRSSPSKASSLLLLMRREEALELNCIVIFFFPVGKEKCKEVEVQVSTKPGTGSYNQGQGPTTHLPAEEELPTSALQAEAGFSTQVGGDGLALQELPPKDPWLERNPGDGQ